MSQEYKKDTAMLSKLFGILYNESSGVPIAPPIPDMEKCRALCYLPNALERELQSIVLKPVDKRPMLGRYKPLNSDERKIKHVHLWEILNVSLKHVEPFPRNTYYEERHPVLRQILDTVERV